MKPKGDNCESVVDAIVICSCGSSLFVKSFRAHGWWKQCIDTLTGEIIETDLDSIKYGAEPKTIKCAECGKRRANPLFR